MRDETNAAEPPSESPGPSTRDLIAKAKVQPAEPSLPPTLKWAAAILGGALILFFGIGLFNAAKEAHARRQESESALSSAADTAGAAIEARLELLMSRVRARGPGGPAVPSSPGGLRRLEATPDPFIESLRLVDARASAQPSLGLDEAGTPVLSIPGEAGARSLWHARLLPGWLDALFASQPDGIGFAIVAPDGRIAGTSGDQTILAALSAGGRAPLELFSAAGFASEARSGAGVEGANPLDAASSTMLWRAPSGKRLIVAPASVAPGLTLIAAAPAISPWRQALSSLGLQGAILLGLGLGLGTLLWREGRDIAEIDRQRRASETLLNLAVTSTGCGILDWDVEGGRIFWSGSLMALTGRPSRGTWLTTGESYQLIHAADVPKLDRFRADLVAGAPAIDARLRLQNLHGRTVWCEARLRLWQGARQRIVGILVDVTEAEEARRTAEHAAARLEEAVKTGNPNAVAQILDKPGTERLEAAAAELEKSRIELMELSQKYAAEKTRVEEANRTKSEFLANMSHELKTPLNAIIGFSEIMQNELYGAIGDERYRSYAADIYESGRQLANLIEDILEMSRIESGRAELAIEDLDLAGLTAECVRLIEPRARDAGVAIDNLVLEAPIAVGDRRAAKRIVMNLLGNAVKFTPRGGRIVIEVSGEEKFVALAIEDNGIGISADDLERIMSPFEQVEQHQSRSHRGAGLGLAISKALSEMQGGELKIESTQGVGTKVTLTLPAERTALEGGGSEIKRAG